MFVIQLRFTIYQAKNLTVKEISGTREMKYSANQGNLPAGN